MEDVVRLTATEVARDFSNVVNRVAAGEEVEVVRNGVAVAQMQPARQAVISPAHWRELMNDAPSVDAEFERDVETARRAIGPPSPAWPS